MSPKNRRPNPLTLQVNPPTMNAKCRSSRYFLAAIGTRSLTGRLGRASARRDVKDTHVKPTLNGLSFNFSCAVRAFFDVGRLSQGVER